MKFRNRIRQTGKVEEQNRKNGLNGQNGRAGKTCRLYRAYRLLAWVLLFTLAVGLLSPAAVQAEETADSESAAAAVLTAESADETSGTQAAGTDESESTAESEAAADADDAADNTAGAADNTSGTQAAETDESGSTAESAAAADADDTADNAAEAADNTSGTQAAKTDESGSTDGEPDAKDDADAAGADEAAAVSALASGTSTTISGKTWTMQGKASYSSGIYTLTESKASQYALLSKNVPLDTRDGFTLSFDYYVGDSEYSAREGFQLIFSNCEPTTSSSTCWYMGYMDYIYSGTYFYGIEFDSHSDSSGVSGEHIAAVYANGSTTKTHLSYVSQTVSDSTWHSVTVTYDGNGTVKVYVDSKLILTSSSFDIPDLCYFGFSASTYLYAFGYQTHKLRNISLTCDEASLVTFNANGGSCSTSSSYILPNSSGSLPTPTRSGYTFKGWYTAASGGTKVSSTNYSFASTQTLYAQWTANTYKVTFNANSGKTSKSSKTVTYASTYGSLPKATRTGYTFSGWYTAKSGGTKVTSSTKVSITSAQTLYAHWTKKSYKVTFKANGGKVSTKTKTVKYNNKIGTLPTPTRSGYTFLGWYTKKSGGKKITSSTKITKKTQYYAHWVKNSKKISFKLNANKGSVSKSKITTTYGGKLKGLPTPTRSGYTFKGWYTKKSGGTKVTSSTKAIKLVNSGITTLYAHWEKKTTSSSGSSSSSSSGTTCWRCYGDGECQSCDGKGYKLRWRGGYQVEVTCASCCGSGKCAWCGGDGKQ